MTLRSTWLAPLLILAAACAADDGKEPSVGVLAPVAPAPGIPPTAAPGTVAPGGPAAGGPAIPAGGAQTPTPWGGGGPPATSPGAMAPAGGDAAACRGFSFEGLVYSPGGNVLPNKCEPFHATKNNPYAVRCIDAWPWYKTKFNGDEFCILPPPPDKGVQYGVHPQGKQWFEKVSKGDMSAYENPSDDWTMEDGEEEQRNYLTHVGNTTSHNYYRAYARMRAGSHHMIVASEESGAPEAWSLGGPSFLALQLPGAQRPDENAPKSLEKPAEDAGIYSRLPANAPVVFNMHHFNASGQQIMKEAWTNLWWEEDARIEARNIFGLYPGQAIGMAIQPGSTVDLHYSWNINQPIRLLTTFGHRHAWTTNFTSWIEEPDGKLDIIYQSFEWLDEPTYRYDSVTQNPTPTPQARTDGATSGVRMLMPGQKLHFNCHIEYTNERAQSEKSPKTPAENGTLRFANEAFTAEMCILFGSTAAVQMATPSVDNSKLPDFATLD